MLSWTIHKVNVFIHEKIVNTEEEETYQEESLKFTLLQTMSVILLTWCTKESDIVFESQQQKSIKTFQTHYLEIDMIIIEIMLDIKLFHVMHLKQLHIFWLKGIH